MKRIVTIIVVLLIITALVVIKIKYFTVEVPPAPNVGSAKTPATPVNIYLVQSQVLDHKLYSSGTILSNEEVELRPEISGRVTGIYFKEGSMVKEGTLLVKINDAELQAQVSKLKFEIKLAEEKEVRLKSVLSSGGASQEEYDAALNETKTLQSEFDLLKAQIAKTEIIAPFSGVIGLKNLSVGSYISPTVTIATLQQLDPVKIDFSVPEKYSANLKTGDGINFTLEGTNITSRGEVYAVEPKIDQNTRTLQVRAISPNKDYKIFPGAFAKIEVLLKDSINGIMIPTEALIGELKGQKVFLCKDGYAQPQKVGTGIRNDKFIQITTGLQDGDSVITTGIMQLKPGSPVKIMKNK